jgi:Mrp family chromosome partitioning ATPase
MRSTLFDPSVELPAIESVLQEAETPVPANVRLLSKQLDPEERKQMQRLVTGVFQMGVPHAPRMVVVTSVERSASSAWIGACAAEQLAAQVRENVCLVDANAKHFAMHTFFNLSVPDGMRIPENGSGPIVDYSQKVTENLRLLTVNPPTGQFNRDALNQYNDRLRREFAYGVIVAPPVEASEETLLLGQLTDGSANSPTAFCWFWKRMKHAAMLQWQPRKCWLGSRCLC